jgi:hypothetical protein
MVKNLNQESFTTDMISPDYYYKTYGLKTLELKQQIEDGIKAKFDETSDVLDQLDWSESALSSPSSERYLFYTMLKRQFEYLQAFDKLDDANFGDYTDIQYFGAKDYASSAVRDQIEVLYYDSKDSFALLINTKSDDQVIFVKSPDGLNFADIYEGMNKKADRYDGESTFAPIDEFKAPSLSFNELKKYDELVGHSFPISPSGKSIEIENALQTIQLSLDEKGGEIKSEAVIETVDTTAPSESRDEPQPRHFNVDNTFALFIREKGKTQPYFAARINDITKFQAKK